MKLLIPHCCFWNCIDVKKNKTKSLNKKRGNIWAPAQLKVAWGSCGLKMQSCFQTHHRDLVGFRSRSMVSISTETCLWADSGECLGKWCVGLHQRAPEGNMQPNCKRCSWWAVAVERCRCGVTCQSRLTHNRSGDEGKWSQSGSVWFKKCKHHDTHRVLSTAL